MAPEAISSVYQFPLIKMVPFIPTEQEVRSIDRNN
jgi:hypothetical protein